MSSPASPLTGWGMWAQAGTGEQEESLRDYRLNQARGRGFNQTAQTCPGPRQFQTGFGSEEEEDHVGEGGSCAVDALCK